MERKRRCGWTPGCQDGEPEIVWARRGARAESCPKSLITAESLAFLEKFHAWRGSGGVNLLDIAARDAEAILLLEAEWRKEISYADGQLI